MGSRVREVFEAALEVPAPSRRLWLEQTCADEDTRREVASLLEAADELGGFLAAPTSGGAGFTEGVRTDIGDQVGPYRLLELIGEGGFGAVFLAEQREPVARQVALKIVKLGMDTRRVVARFQTERRALERMDHPNIARVLDAGMTGSGRPYFVMELVRGEPITRYCERRGLDLRARLELFLQVCAAVQHAHQKGIIHRDLKPSNVLVAEVDGVPAPKVIDFGIARAIESEPGLDTLAGDQVVGTPEYMSPEQAAAGSRDLDTRSDIYSLGVLLYELLTGGTPFDAARLRAAGAGSIQQAILEAEPVRPSSRLAAVSKVGEARTTGGSQARKVHGDLDWIVMRCLEKDRGRRYDSAGSLAADVCRYLSSEPVEAAPPSKAYLFRKFVRRHRAGVVAGTLVALTLVVGIVATSLTTAWAMREADRAERAAAAETAQAVLAREHAASAAVQAEVAERERIQAQRVAEFLEEMLESVRPGMAQGRDTTLVREMLDRAVHRIESGELAAAPNAELKLRLSIAETYRAIAEYASAESVARGAVALAESMHQGDHEDVFSALANLGSILLDQDQVESGAPLIERAYDMAMRLEGPASIDVAVATNNLGHVRWLQGRIPEAESLFADAIALYRATLPFDNDQTANAIYNRAVQLQSLGRGPEAIPLFSEAIAIYRACGMVSHPNVAWGHVALGFALKQEGAMEAALVELREGVRLQRALHPDGHPHMVVSLTYLSEVQSALGNHPAAEAHARDAIGLCEQFHPDGGYPRAICDLRLAEVLAATGGYLEARALVWPAVAAARQSLPPGHGLLGQILGTAAEVSLRAGDLATAEPLLRELLEQRPLGPSADERACRASIALAEILVLSGRPAEAVHLATHVRDLAQVARGEHDRWARAGARVSWQALRLLDPAAAAEPGHPEIAALAEVKDEEGARAAVLYGARLASRGQLDQAVRVLTEAEPMLTTRAVPLHWKHSLRQALEALPGPLGGGPDRTALEGLPPLELPLHESGDRTAPLP